MKKRLTSFIAILCIIIMTASTAFAATGDETANSDFAPAVAEQTTEDTNEVQDLGSDTEQSSEEDITENDTEVTEDQESADDEAVLSTAEAEKTISVVDVAGDQSQFKILLSNYTAAANEKLSVAVWGDTKGQNDLKWYNIEKDGDAYSTVVSIADHKECGNYNAHIYKEENGNKTFVGATTFKVEETKKLSDASVVAEKTDSTYRINISNIDVSGALKSVNAYVWSEENGHDDLKIYGCSYDSQNKTASVTYNASDFKTYGKYLVHIYATTLYDDNIFLGATEYDVARPSADSLDITTDITTGSFKITVKGLSCGTGISSVSIPVWSKGDQSDIVWYTAQKNADGDYVVSSDISKHKNNNGPFNVHVYVKDNSGTMNYITSGTLKFDIKAGKVEAQKSGTSYKLTASEITAPKNLKGVSFAVWSEENGQDDIKWLDTSYNSSSKSASYTLDMSSYSSYGKYNVHAYAVCANGDKVFLGATEFETEKPTFAGFDVSADQTTGNFKLSLNDLKSSIGISTVQIAVWSKSDMSDCVWYTAKNDGSGNYVVNSSIQKHAYSLGTYHAHVYVTEKNNVKAFLTATDFDMKASHGELTVTEVSNQTTYKAILSKLTIPTGVAQVQFAVWSETGGQDDVKWYTASGSNGGDYTAQIDIKNHKTLGKYDVHVYAKTNSGEMVYITGTNFEVNTSAKATVSGVKLSDSEGKFNVNVQIADATSSIEKLEIGAWTTSDMSDICWYTATRQSDGTYQITVDANKHKMNIGNYNLHAYATFANGIKTFVGSGVYDFEPTNYVGVYQPASGQRTLVLKNPSVSYSSVSFAVWCDSEGASQAQWYTANRQSDGNYIITFNTYDFKTAGTYSAHCYANGTFLGAASSFSIAQSELKKNGWYYEGGYKWYYVNDVRQTDVSDKVSGPYIIKVDRTNCVITIYAKDSATGNYIIPVKAMTCSVGLPGTPTAAGTYSVGAKYSLKELMGPSYGKWATKVVGQDGVYFHSVATSSASNPTYTVPAAEYNKLGSPASHGCIRLCVRDAKWIYDNCATGTTIIIGDNLDMPLGKPATIKIPASQTWDPTDPDVH